MRFNQNTCRHSTHLCASLVFDTTTCASTPAPRCACAESHPEAEPPRMTRLAETLLTGVSKATL